MRDRITETTDARLAQLFEAFVAHTDLQLIGGGLITEVLGVQTDSSAKNTMVELLRSRFTQDTSRLPSHSQRDWPYWPIKHSHSQLQWPMVAGANCRFATRRCAEGQYMLPSHHADVRPQAGCSLHRHLTEQLRDFSGPNPHIIRGAPLQSDRQCII